LDSSIYDGRFDRNVRDSGAIMVGAGTGGTGPGVWHAPMCWTNYGSRVDVQGWGQKVTTLGYAPDSCIWCKIAGDDDSQWYTCTFGGTSAGSAIVAGAAAALQRFHNTRGLAALT